MKELEHELDVCRQDVEKQRELVMRGEELLVKQQRAEAATTKSKGKVRAVEETMEEQKRYKQAVEEKRGTRIYSINYLFWNQPPGDSFGIPH